VGIPDNQHLIDWSSSIDEPEVFEKLLEQTRHATEFSHKLLCVVCPPQQGDLPRRKGFVTVIPDNVQLSAIRKKPGTGYELRVVKVEGQQATATVELAMPIAGAAATDLLGKKTGEVARSGGKLDFPLQPWKIGTFEVAV
jgi:alpha-mannosidase